MTGEPIFTIIIAIVSSGLLLGLFQLWAGRDGRRASTATALVGGAHDVVEILREELEEERQRRRDAVAELAARLDAIEADLRDAHDENRRLRRALLQIRDWIRREYDHSLDFTDFGLPSRLDVERP